MSTAVLFLLAGLLLGPGVLDVVQVRAEDPLVSTFAKLALFSVLFTDGMRVTANELRSATLPGRALAMGLPITLLLTAALAHFVARVHWTESLLLGAVLSPTDPVFAAAIVGRDEVPYRLRRLLNVESGLNDGLALPVVVVLLAVVAGGQVHGARLAAELAGGVALGIAIPWIAIRLERLPVLGAASLYQPLNAFALGLIVLSVASISHANEFLAAFAAGITIATLSPPMRAAFHEFGDLIAELLKLAALLLFGALVSPAFLSEIPLTGYAFAVIALVVVRPVALAVALFRAGLDRREWLAAAWFGPKGFASVVYGLLILESGVDDADRLFHLVALVIALSILALSILAHASTDVLVARWFLPPVNEPGEGGQEHEASGPID